MTPTELLTVIEKILKDRFGILTQEITPAMEQAFRDEGLEVVRTLKIRTDLRSLVNREAVKYADARAGELLKDFAKSTPEMLRATVAQALEQRWSVGKLRDTLRENYAFSPTRALSIARTETAIARRRGGVISAKAGGAKKKRWVMDEEACVICQTNAGVGWIDIDDDFPEGDDPHPNCTCTQDFTIEPPDDDDSDSADDDVDQAA